MNKFSVMVTELKTGIKSSYSCSVKVDQLAFANYYRSKNKKRLKLYEVSISTI